MAHTTPTHAMCNNHVNIQYAMPPDIPSPSCLRLSVSQYPSQLPPTLCRKPQQSGCRIWSYCNSNTFTIDNTLGLFLIRALHPKMHCEWKGTWTNKNIEGYRKNQAVQSSILPLGNRSHPKGLHFLAHQSTHIRVNTVGHTTELISTLRTLGIVLWVHTIYQPTIFTIKGPL